MLIIIFLICFNLEAEVI